jgi:YHS domain-containing protein
MKRELKQLVFMISFVCLLVFGLIYLSSCEQCCSSKHHSDKKMMSMDTEQKLCPVSGRPINKEYWTEYKGEKVYFCGPGCKAVFEKDPEKYIGKLPQCK